MREDVRAYLRERSKDTERNERFWEGCPDIAEGPLDAENGACAEGEQRGDDTR